MPTYRITDPATGKAIKVTGDSPPTEAEMEQIFAASGSPVSDWASQAVPNKLSLGDVMVGATLNAPKDVWGVARSLFKTATHPAETIDEVANVAAGGIAKLLLPGLPDWAVKKTPEALAAREKLEGSAEQFGEHYKKRYGGWENIKRSIMEHPAETGLDILTLGAPFAGRMRGFRLGGKELPPEARAAMKFAGEKKLPISPDVFTQNKFQRGVRWLTESIPVISEGGNLVANKMRQTLNEKIIAMRETFLKDFGLPAPGTAKTMKEQASGLYKEMLQAGGEIPSQAYPNVAGKVKGIANSAEFKSLPAQTRDVLIKAVKEMAENKGRLSIETVNDLSAKAWGGGNVRSFNKIENQQTMGKLKEAISTDLQAIEAATGAGVYEAYKRAEALSKAKHSAAASDTLWNILKNRDVYYQNPNTGTHYFRPARFKEMLAQKESLLARQLKNSPEKLEQIKRFADNLSHATMDIAKLEKVQSVAGTMKSLGFGGGGLGVIYAKPLLAVPAGFDAILAHSLMSPRGVLKKWFTEGMNIAPGRAGKKAAITNVLQIGGREAIRREEAQ
ncbi:MAG: hypothetical protein QMD11_02665 [Smithella sp.]|nr:hypothetical protein [Smithella sp.]